AWSPHLRIGLDARHNRRHRTGRSFRRRADSRAARPPELARWSECPKRSRFSSRTLVKARVDMVEENAQCGGHRHGHEHAEDPAPAETRDEGADDDNWRQANRVAHHFRIYEIQDD